jgi:uncharacterized protein
MSVDVRCPTCRSPASVTDPIVGAEVACSTCGTSFAIADSTLPTIAPPIAASATEPLVLTESFAVTEPFAAADASPSAPRPGFWGAVLWSLFLIVFLQFVPGAVGGSFAAQSAHAAHPGMDLPELMETAEFSRVMMFWIGAAQLVAIGIVGLLITQGMGPSWSRQIALRRPSALHLLPALLGLPGLMIVMTGVDGLAKQVLPQWMDLEASFAMMAQWPLLSGIIIIGFGPGIGEELWFRSFIGRGLVGRFGVVGGVLITSLLFGLVHLEPHHMVSAFVAGVFLHLAYLATRSLVVPMLLHTLNNIVSVLEWKFPESGLAAATADQIPVAVYVAASALLAVSAWVFYRTRAQWVDESAGDSAWRPAFPGVELPPETATVRSASRPPGVVDLMAPIVAAAVFVAVAVPAVQEFRKKVAPLYPDVPPATKVAR